MTTASFYEWLPALPVIALFAYVVARQLHTSFHEHMDGTLARRGFDNSAAQPLAHYVGPWE